MTDTLSNRNTDGSASSRRRPRSQPVTVSRPEVELVGPTQQQRGIQLPQLLVSLLVVALTALLILWWNTSTSARVPVLALASDVSQGEVVGPEDLVTVYVSADSPIETSSEQFVGVFVGSAVRADFKAGTLVVGEMFQQNKPLGENEALVGLLLDANQYPPGLATGDSAQVLVLSEAAGEPVSATVETVLVSSGNAWVRLRVDRSDAERLQRAAASNQVALFEVAR